MIGRIGHIALLLALAGSIAGCASERFGGGGPRVAAARPAPAPVQANEPPPVEAVPSGSVTSEPLAPPPGSGSGFGSGPVVADVPSMPSVPAEPSVRAAPAPAASAGSGRSAVVGSYTARDATGTTCRISLSSTPSLDLYKASSAGCTNKDLGRVTAWDFREGEVYLYQPGGSVAARLRGSGGELSGVLAKSGAPITLAR
jgi:hypothetical protein